jgi:hypothetical protein
MSKLFDEIKERLRKALNEQESRTNVDGIVCQNCGCYNHRARKGQPCGNCLAKLNFF